MMGSSSRVFLLAKIYTHGLFSGARWVVVMWIITTVLFTWFVTWDGRVVVLCGIPQEPLAGAGSQEAMTRLLLSEGFCWGWVVVSIFYCLPNVLLPLASSHSISQVLWLRLTPTMPMEMAVGRVCRLMLASSFLGLLGGSWGVICTIYHSVSPSSVLLLMSGFLTHLLVSSGLVLLFSQWARSDKARIVCVFISFVLPCLSCLGYFAFQRQGGSLGEWWPYATPFTYVFGKDDKHLISCAMLGLLLIIAYITTQRGQTVLILSHNREN